MRLFELIVDWIRHHRLVRRLPANANENQLPLVMMMRLTQLCKCMARCVLKNLRMKSWSIFTLANLIKIRPVVPQTSPVDELGALGVDVVIPEPLQETTG